jgi:hypothetical protein
VSHPWLKNFSPKNLHLFPNLFDLGIGIMAKWPSISRAKGHGGNMNGLKFSVLVAAAIFTLSPFARATDSVSIMQIAVTGMSVPGTGGTFTSFSAPTTNRDVDDSINLNPFFFIATSSNGNSGVYAYDMVSGNFTDLADTTMTAATGGTFASFSSLSSGVGSLGFIATDSNGIQGIYAEGYSALSLVATPSTSPEAAVTLGNIQSVSITGNPYGSPSGVIGSEAGIYLFVSNPDGTYSYFAAANNSSFTAVGAVSFKGSLGNSNLPGIFLKATAFAATANGVRSIYYGGPDSGVGFLALASVGSSIPSNTGTFTSFGNPYVTANEVSFTAHYNTTSGDQQGIFVFGPYESDSDGPFLHQIVATGQLAPGSGGATFTGFSDISDSSFDESFIASLSNGGEGLYIEFNEGVSYSPGPQLLKVVVTGDMLDGKVVSSIELAPDASNYYDSPTIRPTTLNMGTGFEVNFTDGSEALEYFTINLPEPASLALLAFPMLLLRRRRR